MKKKRILCLLICFALVWTMMPAATFAQQAEDDELVYLALGDSITTGFGLDGKMGPENSGSENSSDPAETKAHEDNYVNLLKEEFCLDMIYNESKNGNTVVGIAEQLTDPAIQAKVAESDIITITVGGNDLMALLYAKMAELYNAANDPDIAAEDVVTKLSGLNQSNLFTNLSLLTCAQTLLKADSGSYLMDSQEFTVALTAFQQALVGITGTLKQLNPTADIIIATQYNPYVDFNGVKLYNMADLTPLYAGIEDGVIKLNAAIMAGADLGGYHVADVKTVFDVEHSVSYNLYNASPILTDISLDFHPSAAGHAVLADVFGDVIAECISSPEPEVGVNGVVVAPASAALKIGSIQMFEAEVSGTGEFSEAVVWKITGASSSITHIDTDGTLYIGVDETAASLTITATAKDDETKSASAVVSVENTYATEDLATAYQAYLATKAELASETKSVVRLMTAFSAILNNEIELEYEQLGVLPADYISIGIDASAVLGYSEQREAYEADKSAKTAENLVEFCGSIESSGRCNVVKDFFLDYDTVKEEAQRYAPSENSKLVYDTYIALKDLLESGFFADEITELLQNFAMVKNVYDNLTIDDLYDLAELMDAAPEAVKNIINDYVNAAGIIATFNTTHEAVIQGERENSQIMEAFKTAYEEVINPLVNSELVRTLFAGYFEETYNDVLNYIQTESDPTPSKPIYIPTVIIQKPIIAADVGVTTELNSLGTIVTITVEQGYEIEDVLVNGKSIGKVNQVTGLKTGDKVEIIVKKMPTADVIIKEKIDDMQLTARSKVVKTASGKKAIQITWYDANGTEFKLDGMEIYRSVKKNTGYGKNPIFVSETDKYINTSVKTGTKYYYKVRGYVTIDGQKYYTGWSKKAIRTAR